MGKLTQRKHQVRQKQNGTNENVLATHIRRKHLETSGILHYIRYIAAYSIILALPAKCFHFYTYGKFIF